MTSINKQILKARPKLKEVAPLSDRIILGFAIFNILLGLSLFELANISRSPTLGPIGTILDYRIWGIIFIVLGVSKLYARHKNNWELLRKIIVSALCVKLIWFIALVLLKLMGGGTTSVLILWSFISFVQVMTYLYFAPEYYQKPKGIINGSKRS